MFFQFIGKRNKDKGGAMDKHGAGGIDQKKKNKIFRSWAAVFSLKPIKEKSKKPTISFKQNKILDHKTGLTEIAYTIATPAFPALTVWKTRMKAVKNTMPVPMHSSLTASHLFMTMLAYVVCTRMSTSSWFFLIKYFDILYARISVRPCRVSPKFEYRGDFHFDSILLICRDVAT